MNNKVKEVIVQVWPIVVVVLVINLLWRQTYLLLAIEVFAAFSQILIGRDKILEGKIMLYGFIWGTVLEVASVNFGGFHVFLKTDLMNIPLWLPAIWGYGFFIAKRIASIVYTGSPYLNNKLNQ